MKLNDGERTLPLYSSWTSTLSILAKNLAITWADFLQEFSNSINGPGENIQNWKRWWQIILEVFYHDYSLIVLPIQRPPSFKHLNCNLKWIRKQYIYCFNFKMNSHVRLPTGPARPTHCYTSVEVLVNVYLLRWFSVGICKYNQGYKSRVLIGWNYSIQTGEYIL